MFRPSLDVVCIGSASVMCISTVMFVCDITNCRTDLFKTDIFKGFVIRYWWKFPLLAWISSLKIFLSVNPTVKNWQCCLKPRQHCQYQKQVTHHQASINTISGAFAKLRKATIGFVISLFLFVRPHGTAQVPLDGFWWNLIFEPFSIPGMYRHFSPRHLHRSWDLPAASPVRTQVSLPRDKAAML
jgi:hypothetical protein